VRGCSPQCGGAQRRDSAAAPQGSGSRSLTARSPQRHERQAQHHYQQQQRRRREEEERQRHAEHHARRERDAGREEARAEGAGPDAASEKTSAKAKGGAAAGQGPERPKRPGSLLAPNNVMKLKQIIPLQGKFLSSGTAASLAGTGAGAAARPAPAQSPTGGDTRLPAFLSFKFLKSPEARREPERSHSPPKAFHAGKLFPFGPRADAANGAGGQARPDGTPGARALRSGPADEASAEELDAPRAEEEGSGHKL
jgi:anoctamin-8